MATVYPHGEYRPLSSSQGEPPLNTHDIICLHTMVGYLKGTESMFKDEGYSGTESHFGVGGPWDGSSLDGVVWQWQDLNYQADANLDGNWHVISIETSDGANSSNPWSQPQIEAICDLVIWLCEKYDIPPKLIPDTTKGRRGIAYHRQGCDPYRASGGELWSSAYGKTCPGDTRINQLIDDIIPYVAHAFGEEPDEGGGGETTGDDKYTVSYTDGATVSLRYLKKGLTGNDVKSLQQLLNLYGNSLATDGDFGSKTDSAVKSFQGKKSLSQDGVVGPKTMSGLLGY